MKILRPLLIVLGVMILTAWFAIILSTVMHLPMMAWDDFLIGVGLPTVGAGLITSSFFLWSRN